MAGDLTALLIASAVFFASSLVSGIVSFGGALIAVPLLSMMFPLQILVPVCIVYGAITSAIQVLPLYKNLDLKNMSYLFLAGVIGTPLGTYLLLVLDEGILKIAIGVIIIIGAWAIYTGHSIDIKNEKHGNIVAGFLSGLLNGSLTMSGPPVILFYSNNHMEKQTFRANLPFYFLMLNVVSIPVMYFSGLITPEVIHYMKILFPALILGGAGTLLGVKLGNRINNVFFTRLTLSLLVIMGFLSIYSGL